MLEINLATLDLAIVIATLTTELALEIQADQAKLKAIISGLIGVHGEGLLMLPKSWIALCF